MNILERALRKLKRLCGEVALQEYLSPLVINFLYGRTPNDHATHETHCVLLWNVDSFGDSLFATPLIRKLKEKFPNVHLTMVCNEKCRDLFAHHPLIDEIIGVQVSSAINPLKAARRSTRTLRQTKRTFDFMLITAMAARSSDWGRLVGCLLKIPYISGAEVGLYKRLVDFIPPSNELLREWWPNYFLRLLKPLGIEAKRGDLEVHYSEHQILPKIHQVSLDARVVIIQPNVAPYANLTKKWPEQSFAEVIASLGQNLGLRFIVLGTSEEQDTCTVVQQLALALNPDLNISVITGLPLGATFQLVRNARLMICNDSFSLHLAVALRVPTVAIFGATDAHKLVDKENMLCQVVNSELPCSPCHQQRDRSPFWPTCQFSSPRCLERVSPAMVLSAADKLLRDQGGRIWAGSKGI